jgi:hypothetical protein
MPTTYTSDAGEVTAYVQHVLDHNLIELKTAGVTVEVLLAASDDEDKSPPVKKFGVRAYADIRVNGLKDRVAGCRDVRLVIDASRFENSNEARRTAIIHGQLCRVEVKKDGYGAIVTDDAGRPKLKLKPMDFGGGGMFDTVDRFGADAPEYKVFQALGLELRSEAEAA